MTFEEGTAYSGELSLNFEYGPGGRTLLRNSYRKGLFHFAKPYWEEPVLNLQVLNPTAGLFAGDRLRSMIRVGSGACGAVFSPASSHVYTMPEGHASLRHEIEVLSGGAFSYLPNWQVLHRGARFEQEVLINLSSQCRVFYADMVAAGRFASGEHLEFSSYRSRLSVCIDGIPVFLERIETGTALNRWMWRCAGEDFSYLVTALVYVQGVGARWVEPLDELFRESALPVGVSALTDDLVVLRIPGKTSRMAEENLRVAYKLLSGVVSGTHIPDRIA